MKIELHHESHVAAAPSVVWAELSEPARMNQWSLARVECDDPGDGGHPGGPGAIRRVHVKTLGREAILREVVRDAIAGRRLCYRVIGGAPVRSHDGVIDIEPAERGSVLRWHVRVDAPAPVAAAIRALVAPQIERSVARLRRRAPSAPAAEPPRFSDVGRDAPAALWREAESILAAQRALADELAASGDPKRWFARVYSYVTENQLEACRRGDVFFHEWVLRLVPRFHRYYIDNLERWRAGGGGVEAHWQRAFAVMERGSRRYPGERGQLFFGLFLAIRAHIEADLPRALAEVYIDHFRGRCDYVRFRGDYLSMAGIFAAASDRLSAEIPAEHIPRWARALQRGLPRDAITALRHRRFYDIPRRRALAFARGAEIAALLARRSA